MKKAVVLLRGGVDSTVCLAKAIEKYGKENICALNIFYGQRQTKELECAQQIAYHYDVPYYTMDISNVMAYSDSSYLTDNALKGEEETSLIPFRNGLLLSAAATFAMSKDIQVIVYGMKADDFELTYPDCHQDFVSTMQKAIDLGSGSEVTVDIPFFDMTKKEVMEEGARLGVPFELTWSCFVSNDKPCGVCSGCRNRAEAFAAIGMEDPLLK